MPAEPSRSARSRVSLEEFWRLLDESGLLPPDRYERVREAFQKVPREGGVEDARPFAKWLIGQGVLTRYHAKALLAGQSGPFRFGNYVILEPIEEGPLTGLFRGRAADSNQIVLLRFVVGRDLKRPEIVARLKNELDRWRQHAGPGLIVGREWIDAGPFKFFVIDEVRGEPLSERLRVLRVLPSDRACQFVAAAAAAIASLHDAGVAHGAIATANIWIDAEGHTKLLGFPLAREPLTAIDGAAIPASDVVSLGSVLYELLTGQLPFKSNESPIPPDQLNPAVPAPLAEVVMRCLATQSSMRPTSSAEFAALLAPWTGEQVLAGASERPAIKIDVAPSTSAAPILSTPSAAQLVEQLRAKKVRDQRRARLLGVAGVILCVIAGVGVWQSGYFDAAPLAVPTPPVAHDVTPSEPNATETIVDVSPDDKAQGFGEPLWERPLQGAPWNLAYVPSGAQLIVQLRPRELLATAEGERLAALPGPSGAWWNETLPAITGIPLADIEQLTLAFLDESQGAIPVIAVVRPAQPWTIVSFGALAESAPREAPTGHVARTFKGRVLVCPTKNSDEPIMLSLPGNDPALIDEVVASAGAPPVLRREMESLLRFTADDAQLGVIAAPSYLYETCRQYSSSAAEPIWPLLEDWLGRESRAVMALARFDESAFFEIRVVGDPTLSVRLNADAWRALLDSATNSTRDFLATRALIPHSRKVLMQFPQMVQVLASYTRLGAEDEHLVVRSELPPGAVHNLYLASYLAAREPPLGQDSPSTATPAADHPKTLAEKLSARTTLSFPNNSLETTLNLLAEDAGFRVLIEGNDLKIDGITKNQPIRDLNEQDRPVGEILRTVLKKADPAGRLVYLVRTSPGTEEEVLVVTTRAAAAQRGEPLPPELESP
ncbi:MAG: hypothetical protein SGJ19_03715 [Planctomycetia bacterium]|nr:hypothetical protein [Planctomycetia bacterium]